MVFENGASYCLDNDGLTDRSLRNYSMVLRNNYIDYQVFDFEKYSNKLRNSANLLTVKTADGEERKIELDPTDLVCRHLAEIIFRKLKELNSHTGEEGLVERFIKYCKENNEMVRINSCSQLAGKVPKHTQS